MADLGEKLREDKAMRDAAKALVKSSLANVKQEAAPNSRAEALKVAASANAKAAGEFAGNHKLAIGAGLGLVLTALLAWIFRDFLTELVQSLLSGSDEDEDFDAPEDETGE